MDKPIQEIRVECNSALAADTPILVGDQIITMGALHIGYSGRDVKTVGINVFNNYILDECSILEVPQEIYANETVRISLASGHKFECVPSTLISTVKDGFIPVGLLEKGSKIRMILFNSDSGEIFYGEETKVVDIDKGTRIINVPVYLFISEFENILLPYYKEGSNTIGFINIKQ